MSLPSASHPFPPSCLPFLSCLPALGAAWPVVAAMDRYSMDELIQLGQGRAGLGGGCRPLPSSLGLGPWRGRTRDLGLGDLGLRTRG